MSRYLIEMVSKTSAMRRIKDTKKGKYVKKPHGSDVWHIDEAFAKAAELNTLNKEYNHGNP